MQYTEEWFEKNKHTEEWYEVMSEYFRKKKSFKEYLDYISHDIQVINKNLLNKDYDKVREYVRYVENTINRVRKTMEEIPELKTFEVEKFLEESLNEAKAALRRCPSRNSDTTSRPWSDRYIRKEESYQEKKARWDYEESQRYQRYREEGLQKGWFNY
jgi:hypothetical protein